MEVYKTFIICSGIMIALGIIIFFIKIVAGLPFAIHNKRKEREDMESLIELIESGYFSRD